MATTTTTTMKKARQPITPVKQAEHPQSSVHQQHSPDSSEIEQQRRIFSSTLLAQLQETIFQRRQRKIVYKRVIRRRIIRTVLAAPSPPPPPPQPRQDSCDESIEEELIDDDSDDERVLNVKGGIMEEHSQESFELVVSSPIDGNDIDDSLDDIEVDESEASSLLVDDESVEIEFVGDEVDESYEEEEVVDGEDEKIFEQSSIDQLVIPLVVEQAPQREEDERQELKEEWQYLIDKRTEEGLTEEEDEQLRHIEDELFPNRNRTTLRSSFRKHEESVFDHEVGYRPPNILAMVNMAKMELRPPPPKEHRAKFIPVTADAASIGRLMRLKEFTIEAHGKRDITEFNTKSTDSSYALWISNRSKRGQNRKPVTTRIRSNSQVIVNEAAAVGKLRNRRMADPNGLSRSLHEVDIDDLGDDRHDGAKVFRTEHLIDRRIDGDRLKKSEDWIPGDGDEEYVEVDDVILPTKVQPGFKPKKTNKSQKEMMEELAQGVAEGFWKRHSRLERPGAPLRVTEGCNCKYCPTANAWQTFAFQKKWAEARLPPDVSTTEDPNAHGYLSRLYIPEENTDETPQDFEEEEPNEVDILDRTDEECIDTYPGPELGDGTVIMLENSETISQNDEARTSSDVKRTPSSDLSGMEEAAHVELLQAAEVTYEGESVDASNERIDASEILTDEMPLQSDTHMSDHRVNSNIEGTTIALPVDVARSGNQTEIKALPVEAKHGPLEIKALPVEAQPPRSEMKALALEAKPRRFRPLKWLKNNAFSGKDLNKKRVEEEKPANKASGTPGKMGRNVPAKATQPILPSLPAPLQRDFSEASVNEISLLAAQDNIPEKGSADTARQQDGVETESQTQWKLDPKEQSDVSKLEEEIVMNLEENSDVDAKMVQVVPSGTKDIPQESIKDRLKRLAMLQALKEPSKDEKSPIELGLSETETQEDAETEMDDEEEQDKGTADQIQEGNENPIVCMATGVQWEGGAQHAADPPIEQGSHVSDCNVSAGSKMEEIALDSHGSEQFTSTENCDRADTVLGSANQETARLVVYQKTGEQAAAFAETSAGDIPDMFMESTEITTPVSDAPYQADDMEEPTFVTENPVELGNADDMMVDAQASQDTLPGQHSTPLDLSARPPSIVPDATHLGDANDGVDRAEPPVPSVHAIKFLRRRKNNGILARMCAGTLPSSAPYQPSHTAPAPVSDTTGALETSHVTLSVTLPYPIMPQTDLTQHFSTSPLPNSGDAPSAFKVNTSPKGIHQPLTPGKVHVNRFTRSTPIEV
jgi:hypothetical protein